LDGTSKGGVIVGISKELKIPIRFVGIGEKMDDLRDFNARQFAEAMLNVDEPVGD
jgi:fused signal recognition particle receptor